MHEKIASLWILSETTAAPSEARLTQPVFFSLVLPLKTWVLHQRLPLATHLDPESASSYYLYQDFQPAKTWSWVDHHRGTAAPRIPTTKLFPTATHFSPAHKSTLLALELYTKSARNYTGSHIVLTQDSWRLHEIFEKHSDDLKRCISLLDWLLFIVCRLQNASPWLFKAKLQNVRWTWGHNISNKSAMVYFGFPQLNKPAVNLESVLHISLFCVLGMSSTQKCSKHVSKRV